LVLTGPGTLGDPDHALQLLERFQFRSVFIGMEACMGVAEYKVISRGSGWSVLHDGAAANDYASKEAAFESAVAAASLALRDGHEVHVSVPGREAGDRTALGVKDQ
jgi:hypothetical protein